VGTVVIFSEIGIPIDQTSINRPIAEFAPTEKIVLPIGLFQFNYQADKLVQEINNAGATVEIVGQKTLTEEGDAPTHSPTIAVDHTNIWLRDYAPVPFRSESEVRYLGIDSGTPDPENAVFGEKLSDQLSLVYRPTKATLDGGNFLTDGTNCYMSGSLGGEKGESREKDREIKETLGCRKLVLIENPPHVHIDMFVKILDSKSVAVNEITTASLELAKDSLGDLPLDLLELKNSLDGAAKQFEKYLHVVRMPMPVPFKNTFRTYTNAILVNGTAIVPDYKQYREVGGSYPDEFLLPELRQKVFEIYSQFGYKVAFVNADNLIYNGGAFHCVSIHLPKDLLNYSHKERNGGGRL
jgi:agmatine/peptidylarginine deiminase